MAGKTLGERVTRLEVYYAEIPHHLREIKERLDTLNGSVAKNTTFRVQQKTAYALLAFGWTTLLIPLTAIAIAIWG